MKWSVVQKGGKKKATNHSGQTSITVLIYGRVVNTNSLKITHSGWVSSPQEGCRLTTCEDIHYSVKVTTDCEIGNAPDYSWQLDNRLSSLPCAQPAWKIRRLASAPHWTTNSFRLVVRARFPFVAEKWGRVIWVGTISNSISEEWEIKRISQRGRTICSDVTLVCVMCEDSDIAIRFHSYAFIQLLTSVDKRIHNSCDSPLLCT